jgi:hypothetical protein
VLFYFHPALCHTKTSAWSLVGLFTHDVVEHGAQYPGFIGKITMLLCTSRPRKSQAAMQRRL